MMIFYHPDTCTQLVIDDSPEGHPSGGLTVNLVSVIHDERMNLGSYPLTLGQTIQARDFFNRHIDSLALEAAGSLAARASDDPTQMASGEELTEAELGSRWTRTR